jgi:hypothetical protein
MTALTCTSTTAQLRAASPPRTPTPMGAVGIVELLNSRYRPLLVLRLSASRSFAAVALLCCLLLLLLCLPAALHCLLL